MATLEARLIALAQAVGADIKAARLERGALTSLSTTDKTNLVAAINEVLAIAQSAAGGGVSINDAAGDGNTSVTWSADKIFDAIEAAKVAVKNDLTAGAAAALDTLSELATALGNDPNFAATIATQIAARVRFDAPQGLTAPQQTQARANIGALAAADAGNTDRDLAADYAAAKA